MKLSELVSLVGEDAKLIEVGDARVDVLKLDQGSFYLLVIDREVPASVVKWLMDILHREGIKGMALMADPGSVKALRLIKENENAS